MEPEWFHHHATLIAFAHYLDDRGTFTNPNSVIYFFEKPWKWQTEYEKWIADPVTAEGYIDTTDRIEERYDRGVDSRLRKEYA